MATTMPEDLAPWPQPWEQLDPCIRCGIDRAPWRKGEPFFGGKCPDCRDVEMQQVYDWRAEGRSWKWIVAETGAPNQDSLEIHFHAWVRRQPAGWLGAEDDDAC